MDKVILEDKVKSRTFEIQHKNEKLNEQKSEILAQNEEISLKNEELNTTNEELIKQKSELQNLLKELKKTQKQLIRSEKMASIGILASGVAHEINNPLNFIMGGILGLEIECKSYFDKNRKLVKPHIDVINEGVKRAANIVKGLNRFSLQEKSYTEECDINVIIENCLAVLQNKLTDNIMLKRNYHGSVIIKGNKRELHRVIMNVLTNAEQSIREKGTSVSDRKYLS